jgi:Lon protease-like protein
VSQQVPLFPLGTVLFPGLLLPLHVFEDRYRQLVRDLVSGPDEERVFGVVAIREGREVGAEGVRALYDVGCLARLRQVEPYSDGRFDIVTTGSRRFRVGHLAASDAEHPYLRADVELLDEPTGDAADVLARSVGSVFDAYRQVLTGAAAAADELPGDPTELSYLVAAAAVLDLGDRQALLAAPDTTSRLRLELATLRREAALLRLLPSLPGVELTRTAVSPN